MKASVELCINKLSDAAAKSELKANCEKFDSELGEFGMLDGLADSCVSSGMGFWKGAESLANWSSPFPKGMNEPITGASLCKPPRKSVRQDVAKIVVPKLDDTQCGFFRGYSGAEQVSN